MGESVTRSYQKTENLVVQAGWTRYTKRELKEAWKDLSGQGNKQAREGGKYVATCECDLEENALILSALLVRNVFAIPSCAFWDGYYLHFYTGDCGHCDLDKVLNKAKSIMTYFSLGIIKPDNMGPLFADDPVGFCCT